MIIAYPNMEKFQINKKYMIDNKKYIAVEGAIGVGKTTLVKRISNSIKCDTMFEDYVTTLSLKLL